MAMHRTEPREVIVNPLKPVKRVLAIALLTLAAAASSAAAAADYPSKPIRLVIGYAPGGNTDLIGRVYANALQQRLGQPIVVENRPGAAAHIAREQVAKATPDGYTLLTDATPFAAYAVFIRNPTIDVQKAFAPISLLTESPGTWVTRSDSPFKTFEEFISYARQNRGKLNYSGVGEGTIRMTFEAAKSQYGIELVAIDYKSSAEAYRAMLAGDVQVSSSTVSRIASDVAAGRVIALVMGAPKRHPLLPNVPTNAELGFNGFYTAWQGLWGPAGTPPEIVRALHAAVAEVSAATQVRDQLEKLEAIVIASTPEGLQQRLDKDVREWREVMRKAGIPQR
jgi:tripartite-type tricarboxylate transporter receptor subunit TctC